MSRSNESDPSDAGAPEPLLPAGGLPGDARLYIDDVTPPSRPYRPLTAEPLPARRDRKPLVALGAVALVGALALGGLAYWQFGPDTAAPGDSATEIAQPNSSSRDVEAEARLEGMLPPGYHSDACKPVDPVEGALAQIDCGANTDPGGPVSASYKLTADRLTLETLFDEVVQSADTVVCPGNIQSPVLCPTGVSNAFGDSGR